MNNFLYGILHQDTVYGKLFANALNSNSAFKDRAIAFTDISSLEHYPHIGDLYVLFVDIALAGQLPVAIADSNKIFYLYDEDSAIGDGDLDDYCICRHQAPRDILAQTTKVLESNLTRPTGQKSIHTYDNLPFLFGIYNPYSLTLQEEWGLKLCNYLKSNGKVLYLPLYRFSPGINQYYPSHTKDFSDFLFYFNCQRELLILNDTSLICSHQDIDCILPPRNGDDLMAMSKASFMAAMTYLHSEFRYDYIVVGLSDQLTPLGIYMNCCSKLLMPYVSTSPLPQLKQYLVFSGFGECANSIVEFDCKLPAEVLLSDFLRNLNNCKGGSI